MNKSVKEALVAIFQIVTILTWGLVVSILWNDTLVPGIPGLSHISWSAGVGIVVIGQFITSLNKLLARVRIP